MIRFLLYVLTFSPAFSLGAMTPTSNDLPNTVLDDKAPPESGAIIPPVPHSKNKTLPLVSESRENFYASMQEKLGKIDVEVDDLKARLATMPSNRTPEKDSKLTSIDLELKGLHDVINNLSAVRDPELKPLEKQVTLRLNNLNQNLAILEKEVK